MSTTLHEHESTTRQPISITVEGVGDIQGWSNPSYHEATDWEIKHDIDVLGPDFERYDASAERIILDWDDTMKETGKWWIIAHREVLLSYGFSEEETSDENILALFGNTNVGDTLGLERFVKDNVQATDAEVWSQIWTRAKELLQEHPMDPLLIKAIKLAASSGSARFAVWSSSPRELIELAIEANGLHGIFDTVVGENDVSVRKPDPEGFYKAVYATDVARGYLAEGEEYSDEKPLNMNGVWMVGDSPNDIKGGRTAGASTLWLENPLHAHGSLKKRQKILTEAALKGSEEHSQTARDLMPTASIRTFNPEDLGISGRFSIEQLSTEELQHLRPYNVGFARFLLDPHARRDLYRVEKVYDALKAQKVNETAPALVNMFAEQGKISRSEVKLTSRDLTPQEVDTLFDDLVWSIHENTPGK